MKTSHKAGDTAGNTAGNLAETDHLDARGLICPLPVLKARQRLQRLQAGRVLKVRVTDPRAPEDFKLFCAEAGHVLQDISAQGDGFDVWLVRGPDVPGKGDGCEEPV